MPSDPHAVATLFTQLDTTLSTHPGSAPSGLDHQAEQTRLLREILNSQDRQNELLEELTTQVGAHHRQRQAELGQWKQANPRLARSCKLAADALSKVQAEFLDSLTREVNDTAEDMMDGEFVLNEFIDRFGPRLAHLNGVLQVLSQLSSVPNPASNNQSQ
ncbi:MAG: hypothetical protein WD894_16630 [Pirellulales bacterium]